VETKVYDRIQDIQGKEFHTSFRRLSGGLHQTLVHQRISRLQRNPIRIHSGLPLTNLSDHAPNDTWQYICEDAIQIVNRNGDETSATRMVKTRNFIVRKDQILEA